VPIALKDSVRVAGMPTPSGTRAFADRPHPREDSPVTARLREHGATILGKTTMPDLGMSSGVSSLRRNAQSVNRERSSGGSTPVRAPRLASVLSRSVPHRDRYGFRPRFAESA
jgi:amidase/aspartyl-tRNA(Asn)/glutamyl-tRNA(Gln) amidotransferase subunit A